MKTNRILTIIGGLLLAASVMPAQDAPPAPPEPPTPPVLRIAPAAPVARAPRAPIAPMVAAEPSPTPMAAPAPAAPVGPFAPMPAAAPMAWTPEMQDALNLAQKGWEDMNNQNFNLDFQMSLDDAQAKAMEKAQEKLSQVDWEAQQKVMEKVQAELEKNQDKIAMASAKAADKFNFNFDFGKTMAMQAAAPFAKGFPTGPRGSDDSMYNNGLRAIDDHQYDQALSEFNNVVARNGARAEGGLYWKAYVLNKLGRAAEAQAAIDTLRKSYPNSRWLDDSKALELEVKQSKGPVSPESETDEQIKVYALNGLMQSDPEKALPQVEKLLKGSHSPSLKRNALYVIAQNNSPQAQQMLEQIARGGNPDLQVKAIQYMSQKRNANTPQILLEIYTASTDPAVKRAVLDAFNNNRDKDHLLQVLKVEKDGGLRNSAYNTLGNVDGQPELWQIYQSETTTEGKINILDVMRRNGNIDKLAEVARTDKDPKVRQKAIEVIATQESGTPMQTLVTLYSSEQDEKVKGFIIDHLSSRRNSCQQLVDVAKAEKDIKMKLRIVERLSNMAKSCPAANDYLVEILNR